jgi:hypothetical protein
MPNLLKVLSVCKDVSPSRFQARAPLLNLCTSDSMHSRNSDPTVLHIDRAHWYLVALCCLDRRVHRDVTCAV